MNILCSQFLFVLFCLTLKCYGGLNTTGKIPHIWARLSEDKSLLFVMLPDPSLDVKIFEKMKIDLYDGHTVNLVEPYFRLPDDQTINLIETFQKSGLYQVEDHKAVWTLSDVNISIYQVEMTNDLSAMVIKDKDELLVDSKALRFFINGKLQKIYELNDLYTAFGSDLFLSNSLSRDSLNLDGNIVTYITKERGVPSFQGWRNLGFWEIYTFDINTGEVLSLDVHKGDVNVWMLSIFGGFTFILLLLVGGLVFVIRLVRKRRFRSAKSS